MSGTVALRLKIDSKETAGGAAVSARGLQVVAAAEEIAAVVSCKWSSSGGGLQELQAEQEQW